MGGGDALGEGANAALSLRGHAPGHHPGADQLAGPGEADGANQGAGILPVAKDAWGIGQQDQLLRFQGRSQLAGHGVGIDVVGLALPIGGHRGDDGDIASVQQREEHRGIHSSHISNEAIGPVAIGAGPHQRSIAAGETHGPSTQAVQAIDDLLVDPAHQDHLHHIHGVRAGHP